jgi:hypothetical protein
MVSVIRRVELMPRGQILKLFKMGGFQRFGNGVLFTEPFPEINQLASLGTKWNERAVQPWTGLAAGRTFGVADGGHDGELMPNAGLCEIGNGERALGQDRDSRLATQFLKTLPDKGTDVLHRL